MPKLIREGRFGPPKTFKTGAVVGTYPRPLLVLELDSGGLDIIPEVPTTRADYVKLDITSKDVRHIVGDELSGMCELAPKDLPAVTCVDLYVPKVYALSVEYKPQPNPTSFPAIIKALNYLLTGKCPWKTVVLDNTTSLSDAIYGHLASINPGIFADARKWAPAIGDKIKNVIMECTKLPCHFVVIMHEDTDKNEVTGAVKTEPLIYSKYRQIVGGCLSQFFYQEKENGKPLIRTNDNGFIKGLGPRWPELPDKCGVTFKDIYGTAVLNGEVQT